MYVKTTKVRYEKMFKLNIKLKYVFLMLDLIIFYLNIFSDTWIIGLSWFRRSYNATPGLKLLKNLKLQAPARFHYSSMLIHCVIEKVTFFIR